MGVISTKMSELDLAIYAFGQNFTVTAIQHIRAVSAVANGGQLVTPYLVEKMTDDQGEVVYQHQTEVARTIIDKQTSDTINTILAEGVAGVGGAKNAYVAGYRIAAKTGTSEKKGATTTGTEMYICSCVGYAPAEDPEIAMIIMVDEPSSGILYGSTVAAPYIAKTLETVLPYLGIEPQYTEAEKEALAKEIPSYIGLAISNARAYAESRGFSVEIVGEGAYVTDQSPRSGALYTGGSGKLVLYADAVSDLNEITVPDITGQTAATANALLHAAGLNVKLEGAGAYDGSGSAVAVAQSPAAGTTVSRGSVVRVELRYINILE
jgi:stage V sporulation protein D (sporulation-specific penicillin-binding protein)